MGTYWYFADLDRKEYIDPDALGDNLKEPLQQAAHALQAALRSGWSGDRIAMLPDSGDLPWESYVDGHEHWANVSWEYAPKGVIFIAEHPKQDDVPGTRGPMLRPPVAQDTGLYVTACVFSDLGHDDEAKILAASIAALVRSTTTGSR